MKMELKEAAPQVQTKSQPRRWFVLNKAKRYLLNFFTPTHKTISTFAPTTFSLLPDEITHKTISTYAPTTFSSLPDEIAVNCLARISKSYYPKLSLVSKRFKSLILSHELTHARFDLETQEKFLFVCLQLPDRPRPSWFSLWIKPDQILTNDMEEDNRFLRVPSSYSPRVPAKPLGRAGLDFYMFSQYNLAPTSSLLWVCNKRMNYTWRKAPNMKVARENAVAGFLDGKIYVIGGCSADESTNWAEVFDTKTQTWESLPDPGAELRRSLIKTMKVTNGKVYVECSEIKDYVFDPKEGRWDVAAKPPDGGVRCAIEHVWYSCGEKSFWYDTEHKMWRVVQGLEVWIRGCRGCIIAVANYGGKLMILWDNFDNFKNKKIWCSVIALERRNGEVWGNVEWASVVLTVPRSYVFLRHEVTLV